MENENQYFEFLGKKEKYLSNILQISQNTYFDNTQQDIQNFINLMEKREKLFEEIKSLDNYLNMPKFKIISDELKFCEKYKNIIKNIKILAKKIISFDKKTVVHINSLKPIIISNLKNISNAKNINTTYNSNIYFDNNFNFDKSK